MSTPAAAQPNEPHLPPQLDPAYFPAAAFAPPVGRALAKPLHRLLARVIDGLLLLAPLLLITAAVVAATVAIVTAATPSAPTDDQVGGAILVAVLCAAVAVLVVAVAGAAISYYYLVVYQVRSGCTVGKRVMKVQAVLLDGSALDTSSARRRWLASEGVALVSLIPGVGFFTGFYGLADSLWLLWDKPLQQCLHDKFAKTMVITLADPDVA